MIYDVFSGLDLYYTGPVQHPMTAGEDLDYLDRDMSYTLKVGQRPNTRDTTTWSP